MSKLYMYGTELQELEQLMMLVPNFMPRKSGMIVVHGRNRQTLVSKCHPCPNDERRRQKNETGDPNSERNILVFDSYKDIAFSCFKRRRSFRLNQRLIELVRHYDGEIFLNENHRLRFYSVCRLQDVTSEVRNLFYLAVLYLITADDKLWSAAKDHVYSECFDFNGMHLGGINTDGYALYQTARTICLGREYIQMAEIADKTLIGDMAFKAIINAILISKYGFEMLNVND